MYSGPLSSHAFLSQSCTVEITVPITGLFEQRGSSDATSHSWPRGSVERYPPVDWRCSWYSWYDVFEYSEQIPLLVIARAVSDLAIRQLADRGGHMGGRESTGPTRFR